MFKNMRLVIIFDMFLNPSFKMTTSFGNTPILARTTASTRKDFKSSGIESLYEKQCLILNEVKTSLILKFYLQNSSMR